MTPWPKHGQGHGGLENRLQPRVQVQDPVELAMDVCVDRRALHQPQDVPVQQAQPEGPLPDGLRIQQVHARAQQPREPDD
ncbi:hypothetical protein, partial [Corallococcus sp. AB011P]|uniref:hypothetical protein n=1 Tax=Corallococcus sp. AB011P TaxID=2316735 RepID=UPI001F22A1F1